MSSFAVSFVPVKPPHAAPSPLWAGGLGRGGGARAGCYVAGFWKVLLLAARGRWWHCGILGGRGGEGRWPLFFCWRGSSAEFTGEFWIRLPEGEMF